MRVMVAKRPDGEFWEALDVTTNIRPFKRIDPQAGYPTRDEVEHWLTTFGWEQVSENEWVDVLPQPVHIPCEDGCTCETHWVWPPEKY